MAENVLADPSNIAHPDARSRAINFIFGNAFTSEWSGKRLKSSRREDANEKGNAPSESRDFSVINKQFIHVSKDQYVLIKREYWHLYGGVIFRVVDRIDRVDTSKESYFKARNWFIPAIHTFLNSHIANNPTICLDICDPQYLDCLADEVLFSHCVGPVNMLFYLPWESRRLNLPTNPVLFDSSSGEFNLELYAASGASAMQTKRDTDMNAKLKDTFVEENEEEPSMTGYAVFWCAFAITQLESRFSIQNPLFNVCIEPLITLRDGHDLYDRQDPGLRKMYKLACNQLRPLKECKYIRHSAADLFSGAGGASTGYEMAGFNIHWAVERNPPAAKIWELNHPKGRMYGVDVYDVLEDVQRGAHNMPAPLTLGLLAGSSPCQGFSSVNIKGGALDVANRGLIHAVQNYIHALQPKYAAFENVTGMLSSKKGKVSDFFRFLTGILQTGFGIRTKIVNSLNCACPTERRRVICVANRWDVPTYVFSPPITSRAPGEFVSVRDAIEDLPHFKGPGCGDYLWHYLGRDSASLKPTGGDKSLEYQLIMKDSENLEEDGTTIKTVPITKKTLSAFAQEMRKGNEKLQILTAHQVYNSDNKLPPPVHLDSWTPTILTAVDQWQSTHPLDGRFFSVREVARLMTFPDVFRFEQLGEAYYYKMLGNSVPPFVSRYVGNVLLDSDFPSSLKKVKYRGELRSDGTKGDLNFFQEAVLSSSNQKGASHSTTKDVPLTLPPRFGAKKAQNKKKLPAWMKQNC